MFPNGSEVPGGFFRFVTNRDFSPRLGPTKKHSWAKPFDCSVRGSYFMKINDILTKRILKTYSMWEKYVQILYRSINISKIHLKLSKPIDRIDGFRRHISSAPVLL